MSLINEYIELASVVVYYVSLPVVKIVQIVLAILLYVLSPLYYVAAFILLPITYLGHFIHTIISYPFRFEVRTRIETAYIYVGIGVLLGILAGTAAYFAFLFMSSALNLNTSEVKVSKPKRTAVSRREQRRRDQDRMVGLTDWDSSDAVVAVRSNGIGPNRGLLSQTIHEEEDSDF